MTAPPESNRWEWVWNRLDEAGNQASEERSERALGEAALRLGWITESQWEEARAEWKGLRERGEAIPLEQLLVRRRLLDAQQVAGLLGQAHGIREGSRLGRYEIREELGHGGMGRVYRAYDTTVGREVALKTVQGGEGVSERLQREAKAVGRLRHPNIVPVFDVGEDAGVKYLVMELVEGETLEEAWRGWGLRRKVEALEKVARGIAHAHGEGVVHRDLKPGNVMVTGEGEMKVMDFGLARVEGESRLTLTGTVMGTPAYMAPEQVRGEAAGPGADVYALGAMLYEALTGSVPFEGAQAHEVYVKILNEEAVPPRKRGAKVPVELEVVCLKALEKEAGRRYGGAGELAEELRRWREGEPIRARPASRIYRLRKRIRRNPWAWAGMATAGVAACVGLAGLSWMGWNWSRQKQAGELAGRAGLEYAAGNLPMARSLAEQALQKVEGHRQARYWLARLDLREYQARRPLPEVRIVRGKVEVVPARKQTREEKLREEKIEDAFRGVEGEALAQGVLAIWDGRHEEALEKLKASKEGGPGDWEVDLYEGQALYWMGRYDEAEEKLRRMQGLDAKLVGPVWGRLMLIRGMNASLTGQNVAGWYAQAEAVGERMQREGMEQEGKTLRARAELEWGRAEAERGVEPEERYETAMTLLEGIENAEACVVRGDLWIALAEYREGRGRLSPDDPTEYREALDEYTRAIGLDSTYGPALLKRGEAYRSRWEFHQTVGRADFDDLQKARDDLAAALDRNRGYVEAAVGLASAEGLLRRVDHEEDVSATVAAFRQEIDEISRIVDAHLDHAGAHLARGFVHHLLGTYSFARGLDPLPEYEAAIEDLNEALSIHPDLAEAYKERGMVWQNIARREADTGVDPLPAYGRAIEELTRAAEINRLDAEAFKLRGLVHGNVAAQRGDHGMDPTRDFDEAIEDLSTAIGINPLSAGAYMNRGFARRNRALYKDRSSGEDPVPDFTAAVQDFTRALEINPVSHAAYEAMGLAYLDCASHRARMGQDPTGEYEHAISDFSRAIEIDPNKATSYSHRALARMDREEYWSMQGVSLTLQAAELDAAIADLGRALELNPASHECFWSRGSVRYTRATLSVQLEEDPVPGLEEAIADFQRAIEINSTHAASFESSGFVRWFLAGFLMDKGEDPTELLERAIEDVSRALEINPRFPDALMDRALARLSLAQWRESLGEDPSSLYQEAEEDCTRAVEMDATFWNGYLVRGVTRLKRARATGGSPSELEAALAAALDDFRQAGEPAESSREMWCLVGVMQLELGKALDGQERAKYLDDAVESLSRAAEMSPGDPLGRGLLGEALLERGRAEEAVRELREALRLNPSGEDQIRPLLDRALREAGAGIEF